MYQNTSLFSSSLLMNAMESILGAFPYSLFHLPSKAFSAQTKNASLARKNPSLFLYESHHSAKPDKGTWLKMRFYLQKMRNMGALTSLSHFHPSYLHRGYLQTIFP